MKAVNAKKENKSPQGDNDSERKAISEILSEEWKRKTFIFVNKASENPERFVSGYEIYRKFNVRSTSNAYRFFKKLVELGYFRRPVEGNHPIAVRVTEAGKEMYDKLSPFL